MLRMLTNVSAIMPTICKMNDLMRERSGFSNQASSAQTAAATFHRTQFDNVEDCSDVMIPNGDSTEVPHCHKLLISRYGLPYQN